MNRTRIRTTAIGAAAAAALAVALACPVAGAAGARTEDNGAGVGAATSTSATAVPTSAPEDTPPKATPPKDTAPKDTPPKDTPPKDAAPKATTPSTTAPPPPSPPAPEPPVVIAPDPAPPEPTVGAPRMEVPSTSVPASRTSDVQGTGRVVLSDGHVDFGPQFVDGVFTAQARDDTGPSPVWRNVEDVVLWAVPASELAVPADPAYAFLGPVGAPSWVLPQTQVGGIVWPGWNTQSEAVKAEIPGAVDWRLHGVQGPGTFHLFLSGNFGEPSMIFDSTTAFPQVLTMPHNTHTHANWAFSQPGIYKLDIEFSATTGAGAPVSDRGTIAVAVGDVDPNTAFPAPGTPGTPGDRGPGSGSNTPGGSATNAPGSTGTTGGGGSSGSGGSSSGAGGGSNGPLPAAGAASTRATATAGALLVVGGLLLVRRADRRKGTAREPAPPAGS